ncbi:phage tail protein [Aquabacter cavernae]|uniref:phage tail protein n=1 Tax=Aquabacter cavernae TaxID=2496029 RepID=UPI000F8E4A4C|nr:tail fiber protein [Aquabacter cavernae]
MEAYIGEIRQFAGNYAPSGWLPCDGSALNVRDHEVLYTLLGNVWGGDHVRFNLPNLRGSVPIGTGQGPGLSPRSLGDTGGDRGAVATVPPHSHAFNASTAVATSQTPSGLMLAQVTPNGATSGLYLMPGGTRQTMADEAVDNQGGGQQHQNSMPSLGIGYIICVNGEYPVNG